MDGILGSAIQSFANRIALPRFTSVPAAQISSAFSRDRLGEEWDAS